MLTSDSGDLPVCPPCTDIDPKPVCRYGENCRSKGDPAHLAKFSHPGAEPSDLSQEGDQHAGTKFPRMQCRNHPGCPMRWDCHFSHGLIRTDAAGFYGESGPTTCFLGQAPHNKGCHKPTWNGEPFEFCSNECKEKSKKTPNGPLGCRRADCPCPVTVNGIAGQFCCEECANGKACREPIHTLPTAHLVVIAKPQPGKYAPCIRADCACAAEGGSTWNGEAGEYCCRACRNGTPCSTLWHTQPEHVVAEKTRNSYRGFTCALVECDRPTWNGLDGEYCCLAHRHMAMGNATAAEMRDPKAPEHKDWKDIGPSFPDYHSLWKNCMTWVKAHGSCANKGAISGLWFNESLNSDECPSRVTFEAAVAKAGLEDWEDGEFGWHGTKSLSGLEAICWSNWDTQRRSGQACGPGEYFSRGTSAGLHYSEGYAGGDAGHLLVIAWVMSHERGARPTNPRENGACASSTNHIVCNNPVKKGNVSTGEMYCFPIGVVAFGFGGRKPKFRLDKAGHISRAPSGDRLVSGRFSTNADPSLKVVQMDRPFSQCCNVM